LRLAVNCVFHIPGKRKTFAREEMGAVEQAEAQRQTDGEGGESEALSAVLGEGVRGK